MVQHFSGAVKERPSAAFPSSFVVAAYIQVRLWPAHHLVGVARCRSLFVATPLSGFRAPCIWAFLISLKKNKFSNKLLYHPTRNSKKNPELWEMIALT
jgi:hypothetical protein